MQLYIRPVYQELPGGFVNLLSFAVCSSPGPILIDEQILAHFPTDATGKEIKAEFPTAEWSSTLYVK